MLVWEMGKTLHFYSPQGTGESAGREHLWRGGGGSSCSAGHRETEQKGTAMLLEWWGEAAGTCHIPQHKNKMPPVFLFFKPRCQRGTVYSVS